MEAKLFEIRDVATFIPVLAVKLDPHGEQERYLLGRAGYGITPQEQGEYVVVLKLAGGEGEMKCDAHQWIGSHTMIFAHDYIRKNWHRLSSGNVIDVQYLMGATTEPKKSESVTAPRLEPPDTDEPTKED